MVNDSGSADGPRSRIAQQHGVAIAQGRLAAAPRDDAESSQIHMKTEVVLAVAAVLTGVLVMDTLHHSGQETEVGKLADRKVEAAREVRHRFERHPGQTAPVERPHGATLGLHMQSIVGTNAHIATSSRSDVRTSWRDSVTTATESRPVLAVVPQCPSHAEENSPTLSLNFGGRHEAFPPRVLAFDPWGRRRRSLPPGLGARDIATRPSRNGLACDMAKHRMAWSRSRRL